MKGALDAVAHDAPAGSEVGTEVRAVSVHHMGLAVLGAERSELLSYRKRGGYRRVPKASSPGQGQVGSGIRDPGPSPVRAATRGHRAAAAAASNPARLPASAPVLCAVRAWFSCRRKAASTERCKNVGCSLC